MLVLTGVWQINLYREELQGLVRDLERAQLMAREMKVNSGRKDYVRHFVLSFLATTSTNRCIDRRTAACCVLVQDSQYERLNGNTNRLLR